MQFIDSLNTSSVISGDLIKYKSSLYDNKNLKQNGSAVSLSGHSNQNRTKKLGGIIGIAKRSRSIHYTECPSKLKFKFWIENILSLK